jgi:hypothetical protein
VASAARKLQVPSPACARPCAGSHARRAWNTSASSLSRAQRGGNACQVGASRLAACTRCESAIGLAPGGATIQRRGLTPRSRRHATACAVSPVCASSTIVTHRAYSAHLRVRLTSNVRRQHSRPTHLLELRRDVCSSEDESEPEIERYAKAQQEIAEEGRASASAAEDRFQSVCGGRAGARPSSRKTERQGSRSSSCAPPGAAIGLAPCAPPRGRRLTTRSRRRATACAVSPVCAGFAIVAHRAYSACLRARLTSNVRRHKHHPSTPSHGIPCVLEQAQAP